MVQLPVHPAQCADIFEAQYRRENDFLHHFTRKAKQCQEPLLTCMTRHDGECTVSFPGQEAGLRKWDMRIPYSGKFSRTQIFANHQQTRQEKNFAIFIFRDKVTISDHTPYNFPHGNGDPQRVFSTSKRQ